MNEAIISTETAIQEARRVAKRLEGASTLGRPNKGAAAFRLETARRNLIAAMHHLDHEGTRAQHAEVGEAASLVEHSRKGL